jgi:hypothetical protein
MITVVATMRRISSRRTDGDDTCIMSVTLSIDDAGEALQVLPPPAPERLLHRLTLTEAAQSTNSSARKFHCSHRRSWRLQTPTMPTNVVTATTKSNNVQLATNIRR